jgi:hypothetical protein
MIPKIVCGVLIIITVFLNAKHGWSGISNSMSAEETKMMTDIGIGQRWFLLIGVVSFVICLLVLFPQTFFVGNIINAVLILLILSLALKAGVMKIAFIEIPFLLMPLIMIYLGHPLKK